MKSPETPPKKVWLKTLLVGLVGAFIGAKAPEGTAWLTDLLNLILR